MPNAIQQGAGGAGHPEAVTVGHFESFKADIVKLLEPLGLQQEWDRMKAAAERAIADAREEADRLLGLAKDDAAKILADAKDQAAKDVAQLVDEAQASAAKIIADAKAAAAAAAPPASDDDSGKANAKKK